MYIERKLTMSYIVKKAENQIYEIIKKALAKAIENGQLPEGEVPEFKVEVPADRTHGDYSTNAAMVSARVFRTAPMKIAAALCENAELDGTYFNKIEAPRFKEFMLVFGIYASILFISILQNCKPIATFLDFVVKYSFQIYLLH